MAFSQFSDAKIFWDFNVKRSLRILKTLIIKILLRGVGHHKRRTLTVVGRSNKATEWTELEELQAALTYTS